MALTLGYVTMDCADGAALASFWAEALGWSITYQADDGAVLKGTVDGAPGLFLQVVPEPKAGKNRVHLDFGAQALETDLERLVGLGATILSTSATPSGGRSAVLADPEGNEFCVTMNDSAS
jgi:predicted enzyme related to lactoylglutathione lyase